MTVRRFCAVLDKRRRALVSIELDEIGIVMRRRSYGASDSSL